MTELPLHSVLQDEATAEDQLGRSRFVQILAQVLLEAQTPLVVALYGSWGAGKTSMMLQLRGMLEARDGDSSVGAVTAWFAPWQFSTDPHPAIALLHALRRDLGLEREQAVSTALKAIALAVADDIRIPYIGVSLGHVRSNYQQIAAQEMEKRSEQARLRDNFKVVIDAARRKYHGKKLVIFIDDLDRCQPHTAVAVLEALKLYLNWPGCVFILGVDREPIEAAISHEYGGLGIARESYLDKIVQLPFSIPGLDRASVDRYLRETLPPHLSICRELLAAGAPDNPRQLKRTISLLYLYDRLSDSPDFDRRVLCTLALIQNSAPNLYQEIRRHQNNWAMLFPATEHDAAVQPLLDSLVTGAESREALGVVLHLLGNLLPVSPRVINIGPYIMLSERVGELSAAAADEAVSGQAENLRLAADAAQARMPVSRLNEVIRSYEEQFDNLTGSGQDSPASEVFAAANNLAAAYSTAGRLADAIAVMRMVVEKYPASPELHQPEALAAKANLANWTGQAGDAATARSLLADVVPERERAFGSESPFALSDRANLAHWTGQAGDPESARDQYASLVHVADQVLGSEHPNDLQYRAGLARWTGEAGDAVAARDQYASLVPLAELRFGPENPETLGYRASLAWWTGLAGASAAARDLFAPLLRDMIRVLGPVHPETLACRAALARWTGEAGDAAAARDQYASLVPLAEGVLGPEHPVTLAYRADLARWTGRAGDRASARAQCAALLPIMERILGPEHPDIQGVRSGFTDDAASSGLL